MSAIFPGFRELMDKKIGLLIIVFACGPFY